MPRPSPQKLELLRRLMKEKGLGARPPARIPRREGTAPLSLDQERLWFLDQLEGPSSLYHDEMTVRMSGGVLDEERFKRSLDEVSRRHEILRTSIRMEVSGAVQHVHPDRTVPMARVDLRNVPVADRETERRRRTLALVREPFPLDEGPLARALLLRLDDEEWEFALAMHHIVSDGITYGILHHELGEIYAALGADHSSPLPELPIQFGDYAAWERERINEELVAEKLGYWRDTLTGSTAHVGLPRRKPREGHTTHAGAFHRLRLSTATFTALREFCRREEVTSNQILLAGFLATLHTFTDQADLRLGISSSSRTRTELEGLAGFFVRTLFLRGDLGGDPSFRTLVQRVRESVLQGAKHAEVPFDRVVRELGAAGAPIEVYFSHMREVVEPIRIAGMRSSYEIVDPENARFDLSLMLDEGADSLEGFLEYDVDLLEGSLVARIAERYLDLLARVLDHPETSLSRLTETFRDAPSPSAPVRRTSAAKRGLKKMKKIPRRRAEGDPPPS